MAYYIQENCVACQKCKVECPVGAIRLTGDKPVIDENVCISCGTCAFVCNEGAPIDRNDPPAKTEPHELLKKECDLVVLGGGGAGMVAAARAAWLSGKKIIVVEKGPKAGGSQRGIFGGALFPEDWKADMDAAVAEYGFALKQADTLEELAEQIGMEPAKLTSCVERYNAMCTQGQDRDYCKKPEQLVPICKAPYYAICCAMATDGAFGGVPVDEYTRAYAGDGSVFENLYVVGDFASGRFINQGGVKVQIINDLAWAFASGFIAANHAAEYLK